MSLWVTLLVAVKALGLNTMRTALTALGMIIGVAAVIVMVAIGTGARTSIENQIRTAGSNIVTVNAGAGFGPVRGGQGATTTLRPEDAKAIRDEVPGVRYVSPGLNARTQVVAQGGNWNTQVQGASDELADIRSWPLQHGSFFTAHDVSRAAKVAVLGSVARDQLFGAGADPIGAIVRIKNQPFKVVGVLTSKGQSPMPGQDQDDTVIVPFTTVQKKLQGVEHISHITIAAEDGVALPEMTARIADLLRTRHRLQPGEEDDFSVRTLEELATMLTSTTTTMTWLLASIAAVSLLVGGIGIMNIMLVSVTERTREIGLRLSVGARDIDVLLQFLVEAVVLSLAGGALGVALGFGASWAVENLMQWTAEVTPGAVLTSFGFAAAIGIFFGFYPARKAAALDPIDALRFE
ncbi:MAG: ABC transporter permease [Vicinamibacterales bacterium]